MQTWTQPNSLISVTFIRIAPLAARSLFSGMFSQMLAIFPRRDKSPNRLLCTLPLLVPYRQRNMLIGRNIIYCLFHEIIGNHDLVFDYLDVSHAITLGLLSWSTEASATGLSSIISFASSLIICTSFSLALNFLLSKHIIFETILSHQKESIQR